MADVIACARHTSKKRFFGWGAAVPDYVIDHLDAEAALYIRALTENDEEAIAAAKKVFGEIEVLSRQGAPHGEIAFITSAAVERELRTKLETLHMIDTKSVIRILNE